MKRLLLSLIVALGAMTGIGAMAATPAVIELGEGESLPEVTDKPVIIDFNAGWCMPCRMFKPAFDKTARELKNKAVFVSVDIDSHAELAKAFGVRSIPYVLVLVPGREPESHLGAMRYDEFKAWIDGLIR